MTEEQIDGDKTVFEMLTRQHCCPTSDGAGAAGSTAGRDGTQRKNVRSRRQEHPRATA